MQRECVMSLITEGKVRVKTFCNAPSFVEDKCNRNDEDKSSKIVPWDLSQRTPNMPWLYTTFYDSDISVHDNIFVCDKQDYYPYLHLCFTLVAMLPFISSMD